MNPRIVAELIKFTCGNCGTTFAVSSDFIRARLYFGYYLICCPLGHTLPIKTAPTQSSDVIPQLLARIEELEGRTNSPKKRVKPLDSSRMETVQIKASEKSIAMDNLGWTEVPVVYQNKPRSEYNTSNYQGQRNKTRKPGTTQCPYCNGWFKKVRQHARDFHKDVYKPEEFTRGSI